MKKFQKVLAMMLAFICAFNLCFIPTFAAEPTANDFALANTSEIVEIDGINYKYDFYQEAKTRVVMITNMNTQNVDRLTYNPSSSTMYLNGEVLAEITNNNAIIPSIGTRADVWQTLSSESHRITWAEGTTAAVVAGAIAIFLATLGPAGVIAAIGAGSLSILAASCTGGTLYIEIQMFSAPFVAPQYRYLWSFTADTGDYYGPFIAPG